MTTDDPWAVHHAGDVPDHGAAEPAHAFGVQQLHGAPAERATRAGALIYLTVGLFIVAAAMMVAILFMHVGQGSALYEYPGYYLGAILAACLLVNIGLLLARRTRIMATGIAFGTALTYVALDWATFRPAEFQYPEYFTFRVTYDVAVALTAVGAVLALIAGFRLRRGAQRQSLVRSRLVLGPIVAVFGAGTWFAGHLVDQATIHIAPFVPGAPQLPGQSCCTFSQVSALSKVAICIVAGSVILLVVLAAISRSAVLSAGLFIGALLVFADGQVIWTLKVVAPVASAADDQRPQDWNAMSNITATPGPGYWLMGSTLILLLVAGVLCLKLRPREAVYGFPAVPAIPEPVPMVYLPQQPIMAEASVAPVESADHADPADSQPPSMP